MILIERLAHLLLDSAGISRTLEYITVRASMALLLGFGIGVLAGGPVIEALRRLKARQFVRHMNAPGAVDLFEMHKSKQGTPTMGGLLILLAPLVPAILLCDWAKSVIGLSVAMMLGFAAIGFWDDYMKVVRRCGDGMTARRKMGLQILLGLVFGAVYGLGDYGVRYSVMPQFGSDGVALPFFKNAAVSLGWGYIAFAALVLVATSNAINISDGLDGLAIGITLPVSVCLAVVSYLAGRVDMAKYLLIPYVPGAGELAILLCALIGAGLAFLWFNSYPASVFMGDVGSLMIGGLLGSAALIAKQEFLLAIVGGVFVIEALSVIMQVASFRLFKRRIFRMSPLHHHFEKLGWKESKIITRFWIVSLLLALAGLSALKIR